MVHGKLIGQILPNSVAMIAVCVTEVGLVKVAEGHIGPSNVDIYCSLNACIFLLSSFIAYIGMRFDEGTPTFRVMERASDILFVSGLAALTIITLLFAFEVI
ncbi:MAG TPA: hypothetical protein VIJ85_08740 [Rhizomicrobium sp.]